MATPLRAFLITHSGSEWGVTVHREFEDFLETWKRRSDYDRTVGVLHIGFSRPPSREFDSFLEIGKGRLLITAAAKFALPEGYTASTGALGHVGDMPIYLGIRGWGYEVSEDALPKVAPESALVVGPVIGWLKTYLEAQPDDADLLAKHSIFDDQSYFDHEAQLPWQVRRVLGISRFNALLSGERNDPCNVARACPPWMLARRFDTIEIPVRVTNVFTSMDIETVGDLSGLTLSELLDTRNFGRKSAAELLVALSNALDEGPVGTESYVARHTHPLLDEQFPGRRTVGAKPEDRQYGDGPTVKAQYGTLIEAIQSSLQRFEERQREIVVRRMGLGQPSETLQELGERFGVTRERIRQIEAKVLGKITKRETWDDQLTAKLAELTKERSMPLPLHGIEGADPWFAGMGAEGKALAYLLENMSEGSAEVIEIDGTQYVGALTQQEWDEAATGARRLLGSGIDHRWTEEHCRTLVKALLPERCSEFRALLWEQATAQAHFIERDGEFVLARYGKSAEDYVFAILAASQQPLHYSEIPPLVVAKFDREIDIRRAHNAAANVGFLFNRGTYGLDQHVPVAPETMTLLAEEAYQIIAEGPPGRQWHTAELTAELAERDVAGATEVDKYLLDIALRRLGGLERLGRLVWAFDSGTGQEDTYRIDIRQAIVVALQEAGAPLRTDEVRKRVMESRGVDKLFQIFVTDPVIRVAPGLWGLNDRDLPIKRHEQARFLNALVDLVRQRGSGVHYTELERSAAMKSWGLSVTAFFSLATFDPRLRVSTGRYLYLHEWGGPRRESLGQALRAVMLEGGQPLSMAEITELVERRLGRSVERVAVSSQLQVAEAAYDPADGRWSLATSNTLEPDMEPEDETYSAEQKIWTDQRID
ncbi:RNA polymerase principal sigma factor HrdA [Devosia equisanguinis]|uniref:RNA polymerase principal sigma factor HrdA n=1 Tax=Devosia equisanguinis TaxID=2490941 RepID=A0A3S4DP18_9HYPH|nr:DNA-directed RNA polymerase subunit alpha C-terminal domain-containing protein [Devosia equisanguinis]VDS03878.1 RNA polymerase principal sigma factor HrdA [Devosia equisanguinis]